MSKMALDLTARDPGVGRKSDKELLKVASEFVDILLKQQLSDAEKDSVVSGAIPNFNTFVNPGWLEYRKSVSDDATFVEWADHDCYLSDTHGVEFLDCLGGFGIYSCGHRNQEILKVMKSQMDKQCLHSQELVDPLRGMLAKLVSMITPGDLQYSFFCNGGAEAVEMALKLGRLASGKRWYIITVGAFHGKSYGALSVNGKNMYREPYLPLLDVQHVAYNDADALEACIKNLQAVGETVAAFIVEPIQGEAGVMVPSDDYLPRVRQICDKYGVLLIFDEIQVGMGRTGSWWCCDHWGVVPDIMTFGKAFGGGVMPITGIVAKPQLWIDAMVENPYILGSPTFGGNPLACSAAIATIKFMVENDIPGQFKAKGEHVMKGLKALQAKYPKILKDVRGKGLLIGLEYPTDHIGHLVSTGLFHNHIIVSGTLNNARVFRVEPPAIISYEQLDHLLATFDILFADIMKNHANEL
jgi:putrescine aminotransferase